MTPEERALFATALRRTRVKGILVAGICLAIGIGVPIATSEDRTISTGMQTAAYALCAFMAVFGVAVGYVNVIRVAGRVQRLMHALETAPHEITAR